MEFLKSKIILDSSAHWEELTGMSISIKQISISNVRSTNTLMLFITPVLVGCIFLNQGIPVFEK